MKVGIVGFRSVGKTIAALVQTDLRHGRNAPVDRRAAERRP